MLRLLLIGGLLVSLPLNHVSGQDAPAPAKPADAVKPADVAPKDPFQPKVDPGANAAADAAKKYPEVVAAHKLYAKRDVKGSLKLLKTAASKYKELPPAKVMLAAIHFRAKNVAGGKAALDEAVRDHPNHPEPYLVLAELAVREGRFTDANLLVQKAMQNIGSFKGGADKVKLLKSRCYGALVPISQRWKDWKQARADLERWLKIDPDNAVALYRMGEVLFHEKKPDEAYKALQRAREKSKSLPNAAIAMGRLSLGIEDKANAKKWMNYAAANAGDEKNVKLGIANWHWGQKNFADAKKHVDSVLDSNPHSIDAKYLRGLLAFHERDYDNAKRQFESLLLQSKNHLGGNLHLALSLLEQNTEASRQAATELALRLYRAAPTNANVVATVAWIHYRVGKHEQAERLYKSLGASNLSMEAAYYIAKLQADRGKNEEAKKLLAAVVKSKQPFIYARAAQLLLDKLERE